MTKYETVSALMADRDRLRAENAQYDATLTAAIEREDALRAERDALQADLASVRAESDLAHWLLRNARKYMSPMHEALCAAIDNVLQKKQSALAKKDAP